MSNDSDIFEQAYVFVVDPILSANKQKCPTHSAFMISIYSKLMRLITTSILLF